MQTPPRPELPPHRVTWSIEAIGEECLLVAIRDDGLRIAQLHDTREAAEAHARQLYAYLIETTSACPSDAELC
jgi:hypothetical protein